MYVADKDQNIVALIVGDKLFLNTDMIASMEGSYVERFIPKGGNDPKAERWRTCQSIAGKSEPNLALCAGVLPDVSALPSRLRPLSH